MKSQFVKQVYDCGVIIKQWKFKDPSGHWVYYETVHWK